MTQTGKKLNAIQFARIERLQNIRSLASRPQGVSYAEIGCSPKTAIEDMKKMIAEGTLFRRTPTGGLKCKGARFFTSLADADAYFGPPRKPKFPPPALKVIGPAHLDIQPDLSKAKYTIAPPPERTLRTNTHSSWG